MSACVRPCVWEALRILNGTVVSVSSLSTEGRPLPGPSAHATGLHGTDHHGCNRGHGSLGQKTPGLHHRLAALPSCHTFPRLPAAPSCGKTHPFAGPLGPRRGGGRGGGRGGWVLVSQTQSSKEERSTHSSSPQAMSYIHHPNRKVKHPRLQLLPHSRTPSTLTYTSHNLCMPGGQLLHLPTITNHQRISHSACVATETACPPTSPWQHPSHCSLLYRVYWLSPISAHRKITRSAIINAWTHDRAWSRVCVVR